MHEKEEPQSLGGVASAEQGFVILDGPHGVAITFTVEAAQETAVSLNAAAQQALAQRSAAHSG
jgi:hypothetical protein